MKNQEIMALDEGCRTKTGKLIGGLEFGEGNLRMSSKREFEELNLEKKKK